MELNRALSTNSGSASDTPGAQRETANIENLLFTVLSSSWEFVAEVRLNGRGWPCKSRDLRDLRPNPLI